MPCPVVVHVPAPCLLHVSIPEFGLALHVYPRTGRAELTIAGVWVRSVPIALA